MDAVMFIIVIGVTMYAPTRFHQVIDNNNNNFNYSHSPSLLNCFIISLGLSLFLFALSIIEVAPTSWLLLIDSSIKTSNTMTKNDNLSFHQGNAIDESVLLIKEKRMDALLNDDDMSVVANDEIEKFSILNNNWFFFSNGKLSLTIAYVLVLWSMSILVTVVIPGTIVTYVIRKLHLMISSCLVATPLSHAVALESLTWFTAYDSDASDKNRMNGIRCTSQKLFGTFIKFGCTTLFTIWTKTIHCFTKLLLCHCNKMNSTTGSNSSSGSILPTVVEKTSDSSNENQGSRFNRLFACIGQIIYQRYIVLIGTTLGSALSYCILSTIGPIILDTTVYADSSTSTSYILTIIVSWLTAIGIIISTIVNGFGSVSMPYSCLAGLCLESVSSNTIKIAEQEKAKLVDSLELRLNEMGSVSLLDISTLKPSHSFSGGGTTGCRNYNNATEVLKQTKSFSEMGDEITYRREQLMAEVQFLEILVDEVDEEITEMKESQLMALNARTMIGKLRSYIGIIFSIILLIRLGYAFVSVWVATSKFPAHPSTIIAKKNEYNEIFRNESNVNTPDDIDIVTKSILYLIGHHVISPGNYETVTQFIALTLAAFFSYSQVKTFIRTYIAIQHRLQQLFQTTTCQKTCSNVNNRYYRRRIATTINNDTSNIGISQFCFIHFVACLLSCYCIACVVLTKLMLPLRFRASLSAALGQYDHDSNETIGILKETKNNNNGIFQIRLYTINMLFITSAIISTLFLGVFLAIKRQNTKRYHVYASPPSTMTTTPSSGANHPNKKPVHIEKRMFMDHVDVLGP